MLGTNSKIMQYLRRKVYSPQWYDLRKLHPVSEIFGLERGTPIDRYYIEKFLKENHEDIKGSVLEIAESTYSRRFGKDIHSFDILHFNGDNREATIIGDLTELSTLPHDKFDCFICTQTFQFIYNFKAAISGSYQLLKKDGILLATLAGISQISRYDMDKWGDYWRFTTLSAAMAFEEVFGKGNVKVNSYGNVLSAVAFLEGISADELTKEELSYKDDNYQVIITVAAKKLIL